MAYRKRKRYLSNKELIRIFLKKFGVALIFMLVGAMIIIWKYRVSILDYLKTYSY
jgi:hypothetical protein